MIAELAMGVGALANDQRPTHALSAAEGTNDPWSLTTCERWISCEQAGLLAGVSGRRMRQIARERDWPTHAESAQGGIRTMLRLDDVLALTADDVLASPLARDDGRGAGGEGHPAGGEGTNDPRAAARWAIIQPILAAPAGERTRMVVQAAEREGISESTIWRWLKRAAPLARDDGRGAGGEGTSLADRRCGNRNAARHDVAVMKIIFTLRARRESPTIAQVFKGYEWERKRRVGEAAAGRERADEPMLPKLSERTVARILSSIPKAYQARRRGGDGARDVKKNFVPPIHRDWSDIRVMECWMGDGTGFDALVNWPGYKTPIRPWLLTWLDVRSRMIVAWRLVDQVNGGTAMLALRDGWRRYGLCDWLYIDNGKEYENKDQNGRTVYRGKVEIAHLDGYLAQLGVRKQNAVVRNPESKAPQERWYATFSHSYLNLFDAYTGGNITAKTNTKDDARLKADLAAGRVMDRAEAIALAGRIIAAYNGARHSSLGKLSPYKVFGDLYRRTADGVREHPVRVVTDRVLDIAMMRRDRVFTVTNAGVDVLGQRYETRPGDEQSAIAFIEAIGRRGVVAYDPDDLNVVHLYAITNGREYYVCDLVPSFGVKVTDESAAKAAIREQARRKKLIAEASAALIDRQIAPRAQEILREGVLAVNDDVAHADHERRFGGGSPRPFDGRGAGGEGQSAGGDSVLVFPKGGDPKPKPKSDGLKGLFGDY